MDDYDDGSTTDSVDQGTQILNSLVSTAETVAVVSAIPNPAPVSAPSPVVVTKPVSPISTTTLVLVGAAVILVLVFASK